MNVIPIRKPVRLMECYRQKQFREMTERLQAEVEAKRMREMDDHFSHVLAAALEMELAAGEALSVVRRIEESF